MLRRTRLAAALLALVACTPPPRPAAVPAPSALVEDTRAAREALERAREEARRSSGQGTAARVRRMVALGMWAEADSLLRTTGRGDAALRVAEAELRLRQHRYREAGELVEGVLRAQPRHPDALLLRARLQLQAWDLPGATATAESLLRARPRDEAAGLLLGRIRLLERRYDEALAWARRVQGWNPTSAGAYLLEADTRFWDQDPAGAEPPLVRALALEPFDADARFSYGYAIWRRVDATQLDAMAGQWRLALEVDPLHYVTHWHWGNGHTNLTYADYAEPSDTVVRVSLAAADSLIAAGRTAEAIERARAVEREHPGSVLPAMLRGSAFYMAYHLDRDVRLDSALATFREVLRRKPNYGPAHNGVAAVIKQRQFGVLARFDSLEAEIARTPTPPDPALEAVFPDVRYYPGDRVEKMVRRQLGASRAYLPMIQRQGRRYRIPPLHKDLAEVMGNSYFRTATTFDNRQWMDIRGVGSGAAAIEYVERGAHQERNVLLHEFVHLFHGIVFTDRESRRVRELYHAAMAEDRTLDYYAANNESEFLAQAYPAYFAPVKIHPLNHKSMATRALLREKDPATYAWIDSLVTRQEAYLAGDTSALASNWAQVYVNLAEQARRSRDGEPDARRREAAALLDSALVWDAAYLPAILSYAALAREAGRFEEAERWLARAESIDPAYAPIYSARAVLEGRRAAAAGGEGAGVVERQAALYRRALELERDLAVRAQLSESLRELHRDHGQLAEAIRVAEAYVESAPTISTYLRDRRDEAAAFAHELRARAGYAGETLPFFRELVARKPQHYGHRAQLADALLSAGLPDEAAATLEEAQRILRAGGRANAGFAARLAEIHLLRGDSAAAREALRPVLDGPAEGGGLRLVRVLQSLGQTTEAHRRLNELSPAATPAARAEHAYTRGWIAEWRGDEETAERAYAAALAADPYHQPARVRLVRLLDRAGRGAEAEGLVAAAARLPLPLGPDFARALATPAEPAATH